MLAEASQRLRTSPGDLQQVPAADRVLSLTGLCVVVCSCRVRSSSGEPDLHQTDDQHWAGCERWKPAGGRHHPQGTSARTRARTGRVSLVHSRIFTTQEKHDHLTHTMTTPHRCSNIWRSWRSGPRLKLATVYFFKLFRKRSGFVTRQNVVTVVTRSEGIPPTRPRPSGVCWMTCLDS